MCATGAAVLGSATSTPVQADTLLESPAFTAAMFTPWPLLAPPRLFRRATGRSFLVALSVGASSDRL